MMTMAASVAGATPMCPAIPCRHRMTVATTRPLITNPLLPNGGVVMRSHHKTTRFHLEQLEPRRLLSFSAAVNYPVGGSGTAVATADFNGDGVLDLAVPTLSTLPSDTVSV